MGRSDSRHPFNQGPPLSAFIFLALMGVLAIVFVASGH